jgi:hypothetical protein
MKSRMFLLTGVALLAWLPLLRGEEGHETGQSIRLSGRLDPTDSFAGRCYFSAEIERIAFNLTSLNDKYKVIRIRVENEKGESIKLSVEKDGIALGFKDGQRVRGTFNLKSEDGPVWDSLSDEMRSALAYPLSIRAAKVGDASRTREVVHFFAFFPADKVTDVPNSLDYTIESLGKTITLTGPPQVKP